MKVAYVLAHFLKLPQLRAKESLQQITNTAIGSGTIEKGSRRSILNRLYRETQDKQPRKKLTKEQQAYMLQQMGIKLECLKN